MGLAATSQLGYWFEGLNFNLNSLYTLRDVRRFTPPAIVARFATVPSRQPALQIFEALH
jgi:hypothetical protein